MMTGGMPGFGNLAITGPAPMQMPQQQMQQPFAQQMQPTMMMQPGMMQPGMMPGM